MDVHEYGRVTRDSILFERDVRVGDVWEADWQDGSEAEGFVDESADIRCMGEVFDIWKPVLTDDAVDFGLGCALNGWIGEEEEHEGLEEGGAGFDAGVEDHGS